MLLKSGAQITFDDTAQYYGYPDGVIFVQTVYLDTIQGDPGSRIYLETRLLVKRYGADDWIPLNYRWNEEQTDAVLLKSMVDTVFQITAPGGNKEVRFRHEESFGCAQCHAGRFVNSFYTAQLNRPDKENPGINQITRLFNSGVLSGLPPANPEGLPGWLWDPSTKDSTEREHMARAYLAVQCSHCHGILGHIEGQEIKMDYHTLTIIPPNIIGRYTTAYVDDCWTPKIIVPGSAANSTLYFRQAVRALKGSFGVPTMQMPPVASFIRDTTGLRILKDWICSLDTAFCASPLDTKKQIIYVDSLDGAEVARDTSEVSRCAEIAW